MPLLLMLWCNNVVKRNWIIILMQTVLEGGKTPELYILPGLIPTWKITLWVKRASFKWLYFLNCYTNVIFYLVQSK